MTSSALNSVSGLVGSRYKVLKPIGEGSFGAVSLVQCRSNGQLYACKVVQNPKRHPGSGSVAEARILMRVLPANKRIVRMREILEDPGRPAVAALVMGYANGGDLYGLVRAYQHPPAHIPEPFLWHLFLGVAQALAFLHYGIEASSGWAPRRGWRAVIHGDVKPGNVLLSWPAGSSPGATYPRAVLADFGVSVCVADPTYNPHAARGTPGFMAPERQCTGASDVFALGATVDSAKGAGPGYSRELAEMVGLACRAAPERRASSRDLVRILNGNVRELIRGNSQPLASFAFPRIRS